MIVAAWIFGCSVEIIEVGFKVFMERVCDAEAAEVEVQPVDPASNPIYEIFHCR